MCRTILVSWLLCFLAACGDPRDPTTPKGAFAMVGPCIDKVSRECLFRRLERETRWSVCTVHRTLQEMRGVVEKSYPESRRISAYGAWADEAQADTPEAFFEIFCKKRQCLEKVARGFGAVKSVTMTEADTALVETIRGGKFKWQKKEMLKNTYRVVIKKLVLFPQCYECFRKPTIFKT